MAFVTRMKQWIKSRPVGLYLTERHKKRMYEAYLRRYDDRDYIDLLYAKINRGAVPNVENPKSFTDKLQWLKLYYRDPLMTRCSDKAEVKTYLRELGMGQLAVPTLALYERAEDIDETSLPPSFVLKATHGCGWQWICRDGRMNWKWAKRTMAVWLSESLYMYGREWNYKDQTPRMMAEPLLSDEPLDDYKFWCFNGTVKIIQRKHVSGGTTYIDFYDPEWKLLQGVRSSSYPCSGMAVSKPPMLTDMTEIARTLSAPFPFVRVDMYDVNGTVYVGEMTFFPGGGFHPVLPLDMNEKFGRWLTLPPKNHE